MKPTIIVDIMKYLKYIIVVLACFMVGFLMFNSYTDRKVHRQDELVVYHRQNDKTTDSHTKGREDDDLPESARIPGDKDLARLNETTLLIIYWKYINTLQILCKDVVRIGSLQDGGKEICIDPDYKPHAPCLVYSFGINNEFDFDKGVVETFGCDVHCFDPSMKDETRQLSEHVWFYRWGIGGKNEISSKQWTLKTLDTIRHELGHTHRTLDLLKIDIEGDEWNAIPQMISSGALDDVRQISMETHFSTFRPNMVKFWGGVPSHKQLSALRQLYDFGYRIFMRERNLGSYSFWPGIRGPITNVNEISMIKPNA